MRHFTQAPEGSLYKRIKNENMKNNPESLFDYTESAVGDMLTTKPYLAVYEVIETVLDMKEHHCHVSTFIFGPTLKACNPNIW